MNSDSLIELYNIYIYNIVKELIDSGKKIDDFDFKSDLNKIFEYFSCIKLTQEYKTPFYEYNDIPIKYKELNCMSINDTGIDACNLKDTIVQCKLRQNTLTWKECATFFGSVNYMNEKEELQPRWTKLIITRNQECKLSNHLNDKLNFKQFKDKSYSKTELLTYCKNLIKNPPKQINTEKIITKRNYQEECIKLINNMENKNLIICLPTGTGKNFIISQSLQHNLKYLIMVPRILLMEQLRDEIIKFCPKMKSKIQLIGDSYRSFNKNKNITICVYNSVNIVKKHIETFAKIFIDEAHHIIKPEIYKDEDDLSFSSYDLDSEYEDDFLENSSNINNELFNNSDDDLELKEENEVDNFENENCDNKTFIKTIKEFSKLDNNIYLSATIDEHNSFNFYKKDIREMIDEGYLCDYTINIPIFNEDPTNISVCKYLIKYYRNIIIYCNSQIDGNSINKIMNSLQNGCSEYIDCYTSRNKRNNIINNYKIGNLPFIINVKILVEGFDAPITKGVCFMSLPSSNTTLIQIIGRALRLHNEKLIANVILPFSNMKDEKAICNFLKIMAKNDSNIAKSYNNKKNGGYLEINNIINEEEQVNENLINDIEIKYELIFNSIGSLKNKEEIWDNIFNEVIKYIDKDKKLPLQKNKNKKIKYLGIWLSHQKKNYKNIECIMKNDIIYNKFTIFLKTYNKYFISHEELWYNNLEKLITFIENNKKIPSVIDKNKEIKSLGMWIITQKIKYKLKKEIMKNTIIYNKFTEFKEKYKKYLLSYEENWNNNLEKVIKYINKNNKLPSNYDKDNNIQFLGRWLSTQKKNYKNIIGIMKNIIIYNQFKSFLEKYKKYFLSNEEIWNNTLTILIKYINDNNKLPSNKDKNKKIQILGSWFQTQKTTYNNKQYIMKNDMIYNKFKEFKEKYKN